MIEKCFAAVQGISTGVYSGSDKLLTLTTNSYNKNSMKMNELEYDGYVLEKSDKYYKKLDKVKEWNKKSKSSLIHNSFNPTVFQSYTLPILHSPNLTFFQSYTLPILHSCKPTLFQSYTLPIPHSFSPTHFQHSNTLTF